MSEAQYTPATMRFKLFIVAGKGKGREFVFDQPHVTIGRMPSCDLVLFDTNVSRGHCQIAFEYGEFVLRDIGSANGTFLNESLTTEAYLYHGDRIGVGPVTFEFRMELEDGDLDAVPDRSKLAWDGGSASQRRRMIRAETQAIESDSVRELMGAGRRPSQPVRLGSETSGSRSNSASGSLSRRRRRRRRLPRSKIVAVISAALVLGTAAIGSYLVITHRPKVDRSGEVFAVNESNAELRFGAGKVDVYTPRSATFAFDYEGGKATLEFATGGIDTDDEVSVELNGKPVGHAPASPARWTAGHTIDLPRELLYNGRNLIAFKHHPLAGSVPRWGIARVLVRESPLPEVDVERAQQLFDLGKAAFDTRTVARPNLARAIEYLEQASLFLEGVDERPPLYYDIAKSLRKAERELQETFESHIFAAEQAIRFGERSRAIESLQELLQYIPNPEDARHEEAKSRLDALQGVD